jgi:pantothenate kinase
MVRFFQNSFINKPFDCFRIKRPNILVIVISSQPIRTMRVQIPIRTHPILFLGSYQHWSLSQQKLLSFSAYSWLCEQRSSVYIDHEHIWGHLGISELENYPEESQNLTKFKEKSPQSCQRGSSIGSAVSKAFRMNMFLIANR